METDSKSQSTMQRFSLDQSVSLTIPEQSKLTCTHSGDTGTIIEVFKDDLGKVTGDPRDSYVYLVEFSDGDKFKARDSDLESAN